MGLKLNMEIITLLRRDFKNIFIRASHRWKIKKIVSLVKLIPFSILFLCYQLINFCYFSPILSNLHETKENLSVYWKSASRQFKQVRKL